MSLRHHAALGKARASLLPLAAATGANVVVLASHGPDGRSSASAVMLTGGGAPR